MPTIGPETPRPTRFKELGYWCWGGLWRIVDIMDPSSPSEVGPHYITKAELLADLDRYAADFGCEAASQNPLHAAAPEMLRILTVIHGWYQAGGAPLSASALLTDTDESISVLVKRVVENASRKW